MDTETKPLWETKRDAMGKTYTVSLYPNNAALEDGNCACDGAQVRHMKQQITINSYAHVDSRDEALLHELLHVACRHCSIVQEEAEINRLSGILYAILRGFGLWQDFPWPDRKRVKRGG